MLINDITRFNFSYLILHFIQLLTSTITTSMGAHARAAYVPSHDTYILHCRLQRMRNSIQLLSVIGAFISPVIFSVPTLATWWLGDYLRSKQNQAFLIVWCDSECKVYYGMIWCEARTTQCYPAMEYLCFARRVHFAADVSSKCEEFFPSRDKVLSARIIFLSLYFLILEYLFCLILK